MEAIQGTTTYLGATEIKNNTQKYQNFLLKPAFLPFSALFPCCIYFACLLRFTSVRYVHGGKTSLNCSVSQLSLSALLQRACLFFCENFSTGLVFFISLSENAPRPTTTTITPASQPQVSHVS